MDSNGVSTSNSANYSDQTAEVSPKGGSVGESSQNSLNSGLGYIVICPASCYVVHLEHNMFIYIFCC